MNRGERCSISGDLRAEELARFYEQLLRLQESLRGTAEFETMERWLAIRVAGDGKGHLAFRCIVSDEPGIGNTLDCTLATDQTFTQTTVAQLGAAVQTFPVIGSWDRFHQQERRIIMGSSSGLTMGQILAVFTEEVEARQGRVTDTFNDGRRLFTRSVLAPVEEVRPGDRVQGGVALKATEGEVCLFPYLFRLVCRNGAIMAQTLEARSLGDLPLQDPETARQSIREGVGACCAEEVFADTVRRVRTACETAADLAITLLPLLSRFSGSGNAGLASQIMDQFFREGDRSQFGLGNVVTAIARDTRDPDLRWDLEEFGGGVLLGQVPQHPAAGGRVARAESKRAVLVG